MVERMYKNRGDSYDQDERGADHDRVYRDAKREKAVAIRKKACRFCVTHTEYIDYKDTNLISTFITERGKIIPRRVTGACAKHQRMIATAVKRARILAFIPFSASQIPI